MPKVWIYYVWLRISTWLLNCILSVILVWWFGLNDVTITIGEFGFLSVHGIKVRWNDDPGVTIEEVSFKKIEWNFEKIRDFTILFSIKDIHKELFTDSEDTTTDIYTSFTFHWKMHSPSDLVSSDLRNSSETIPPSFTLFHATDMEIGSRLHVHRGGSYVALFEAAVVDGLVIPSREATSLFVKGRDMTYCCGPYDPGLIQARREKILKMSLLDFRATFYLEGPSQITSSYHGVQIFVSPSKVNSSIIYQNHLLAQLLRYLEPESSAVNDEVNVNCDNSKASVCFQDGREAVSVIMSFNLSLHHRNKKTQYTALAGIQAFVPSREQTTDPCVIIGNDFISVPWECTITGSNSTGHSTVARITSDQNFSLVLRPECIPIFQELHKEYSSLLNMRQVNVLFGLLKKKAQEQQSSLKQIFINFRGVRVSLEMDVYEELLNVSLEDIKTEFTRDQHHTTLEFSVKDLEVEDCTDKIIAFQLQRTDGVSSQSLLRFSFFQDAASEEERIVVKRLHTELGNSTVSVQEKLILKLLQFADIRDKTQLWGEETNQEPDENSNESLPAFLTTTRVYFEKLHVEPFEVVVTCSPAITLPDELQSLKTVLEIPAGFPPLMENANIKFGEFLRTGISYKTLVSLGRDARRHYLKEIGRQSTSLLGSLHLLGNLSSLHWEIAGGLADLKETGDYMGFVRHVRGGLAESYYKFADSWTAAITQSQSNSPSSSNSKPMDSVDSSKKSVRGVVGSLTSFLLSPPKDAGQARLQLSNSPTTSPPGSPGRHLTPRRLAPTDSEDQDSSGSEENSFSCIPSVDGWEMVPRDVHRKLKGQEFLHRLQLSMRGEVTKNEIFVSCLKLRHRDPEDKLNALVTSQHVYFMRVGSPSADHVVLTIRLFNLYKARHRDQDQEHYLELLYENIRRQTTVPPLP
ncbi:Vacuolar protein sorting-associated protein 13D [Desmophyllum pertusum]|uniref:Vacuolar protein sorting-associated protein 13D n=1 Tax=Desmophyllum pertusum TaxID=174260 RepID=A0A9W9ZHF6_9CNID|nr:Vacuolar protein sorting-associated protein 13D [Desmophyllum pertusum]